MIAIVPIVFAVSPTGGRNSSRKQRCPRPKGCGLQQGAHGRIYTEADPRPSMALYRKAGDWMVLWDDRYLMILAKEGPQTPSALADREHIHVSAPHTSHRLLKMADHGLVESSGTACTASRTMGSSILSAHTTLRLASEWLTTKGTRPTLTTQSVAGAMN